MKSKTIIIILVLINIAASSFAQQKKIDVTYIANSGFLIESSGKQILIDALFNQGWGNYLTPTDSIASDIITKQPPFTHAKLMLITHNHGDHFNPTMVAAYLINNSENILVAPPKVTNVFSRHPDYKKFENQIVQLDENNGLKIDTIIQGVSVRSFFLQHDSRPAIENVGYIIEIDKLKIFHSGDFNGSEIVEFEKLQLQNEDIDLALLNFYGFWSTKEEREFAVQYINPKNITLMHIPPAEIQIVKDSVKQITDFIDITVFEGSMERKSFLYD